MEAATTIRFTEHGENIANQINGEDAYGYRNNLNPADVWNIVDQLHSHFLDMEDPTQDKLMGMLEGWMGELTNEFDIQIT